MPTVQNLEIHHVGMSGGDSTLILVRWKDDNDPAQRITRVLIDAGGETYDAGLKRLRGYLARYTQGESAASFDLVVTSHYHADHMEGFQRLGIQFSSFMDAGGYAVGSSVWTPVNPLSTMAAEGDLIQAYSVYMTKAVAGGATRRALPFALEENWVNGALRNDCKGPVAYDLVPGGAVQLTCYCAAGVLADGTNALRDCVRKRILYRANRKVDGSDLSEQEKQVVESRADQEMPSVSPNDLSLAFILSWNGFTYFTAGDLSGDLSLTRYANVEEPLVAYLRGAGVLAQPVTAMKATHHGSNHNNYGKKIRRKADYTLSQAGEDQDPEGTGTEKEFEPVRKGYGLLDELRPETIVVSCNQMKGVPGGEYVDRVKAYCGVAQNGRTLTVSFVNHCLYPHPQYNSKQKSDKAKMDALAAAVANTGLQDVNGTTTNRTPQVVVVNVPALDPGTVTGNDVTLLSKATHSVKIDRTVVTPDRKRLSALTTGQALPNLNVAMYNAMYGALEARAAEIVYFAGKGGKMDYVRRRFPWLVDTSQGMAQLKDAERLSSDLEDLLADCFTLVNGVYEPSTSGTWPAQRTTMYSLLNNTPDPRQAGSSLLGETSFDQEVQEYWDENGVTAEVELYGSRLRPRKKQKA